MALSAPLGCMVHTLDLLPDKNPEYSLASGERHMVDKEQSGERFLNYAQSNSQILPQICQVYGDSATFDFSPYHDSCSLVFVDGSHAYEYATADTKSAMQMVKAGGVIVWHDYGIWEGVTRALEELEDKDGLGIKNIAGTSLAYWRKD